MATLYELADKVIRENSGGVRTDENILDIDYVYALIHSARAFVLRTDYLKYKRWSPQAVQMYYPDYESSWQDSVCYTRFRIPTAFIQGNSSCDGLVYFGNASEKVIADNFFRIKNRAELSDLLNHPVMSPKSGLYTGVMVEGLMATVISKVAVPKHLGVAGVFDNPQAIESYNVMEDQYPLSYDLQDRMLETIQQGTMKYVMVKPADTMSNTKTDQPTR